MRSLIEHCLARPLVAFGVALFCCGVAPTSWADAPARSFGSLSKSERQELETYVQNGLEAYDRRNFVESISQFEKALAILEHPDFVYRIALAYERLGREKRALEYYRRFLEMAPDSEDRPEVERTMQRLEKKIARQRPTLEVRTDPAGAVVRIDGRDEPLGRSALTARLTEGTHTLTVSKPGFRTVEREVELDQGESLSLDYDLKPADAASGPPTGAVILFGTGGVAAVGSAVSYLRFSQFRRTVRNQRACTPDCSKPGSFDRNVRSQKTWEGLTWGSGALAVGAVAGGAVWMALGGGSAEGRARGDLSISVAPRVSARFVGIDCAIRARPR